MLTNVDTRKIIGKRIKLARVEAELSQDSLAELLGTTQKALSRWELGKVEVGAVTLAHVAKTLRKPIEFFYQPFEDAVAIPKAQARRRKAA
jgi:transcriptional regulator with XRE-family HTH domain